MHMEHRRRKRMTCVEKVDLESNNANENENKHIYQNNNQYTSNATIQPCTKIDMHV